MFEHREAVPTPLSGGTIAHSLILPAHLAPCHDIRYSRWLPDSLVRSNSQLENAFGELHVCVCVCVCVCVLFPFIRNKTDTPHDTDHSYKGR